MTDQDHEGRDMRFGVLWVLLHKVCEELHAYSDRDHHACYDADDQKSLPAVGARHALLATELHLVVFSGAVESAAPLWRHA